MEEAARLVDKGSKKEVTEVVERGLRAESRLARVERTRRQEAIAVAGMGAEVAGSLLGGAAVGWMQANDYEEYGSLVAVGAGVASGMKRLQEPNNQLYQILFAAANGAGAAIVSGYVRDYFSGGEPKPMT